MGWKDAKQAAESEFLDVGPGMTITVMIVGEPTVTEFVARSGRAMKKTTFRVHKRGCDREQELGMLSFQADPLFDLIDSGHDPEVWDFVVSGTTDDKGRTKLSFAAIERDAETKQLAAFLRGDDIPF
jgi:hypothetical protein